MFHVWTPQHVLSQSPGHWAHYPETLALSAPSPVRRALYPDGDWMRDNGGRTELLDKDQLIATVKSSDSWACSGFEEFWTCLAKQLYYNFVCVKDILLSLINYWIDHSVCFFSSSPGNQIRIPTTVGTYPCTHHLYVNVLYKWMEVFMWIEMCLCVYVNTCTPASCTAGQQNIFSSLVTTLLCLLIKYLFCIIPVCTTIIHCSSFISYLPCTLLTWYLMYKYLHTYLLCKLCIVYLYVFSYVYSGDQKETAFQSCVS